MIVIRITLIVSGLSTFVLAHNLGLFSPFVLQIASCAVHHSGALLLEARDGAMLDDQLRPLPSPSLFAAPVLLATNNSPMAGAAEVADDYNEDFGDFEGGEYSMDVEPSPTHGSPGELPMKNVQAVNAPVTNPDLAAAPEAEEKSNLDPYEPLDPSDATSMASKPFKKASRVARKPKSIACVELGMPHAILDGLLMLPAPATSLLLLPEFQYAQPQVDASYVRRSKATGDLSRQRATVFTLDDDAAALETQEGAGTETVEEIFFDAFGDDGGVDAGPNDDYNVFTDFGTDDVAAPWSEAAAFPGTAACATGTLDAGFTDITYEEMCRAHVEAYIQAAAAAEVQTDLAARVSGWQRRIAPLLEEEESRPEFDIHIYGEHIIEGLAALSVSPSTSNETYKSKKNCEGKKDAPELTFDDVLNRAQADQQYDVPRTFSSMLQLVNNGNIRINKLGGSNENFRVTLLNTVLPHKKFSEYLAPSSKGATDEGEQVGRMQEEVPAAGANKMPVAAKKTSKRRKAA